MIGTTTATLKKKPGNALNVRSGQRFFNDTTNMHQMKQGFIVVLSLSLGHCTVQCWDKHTARVITWELSDISGSSNQWHFVQQTIVSRTCSDSNSCGKSAVDDSSL